MKVNMSMIDDMELAAKPEIKKTEDMEEVKEIETGMEEEEDEYDNSDKHSKVKTLLLIAAMVGGLGLAVWNMTGFVNNLRLDNQGYASSIVSGMEDKLSNFMDGSEGSSAADAEDVTGSAVSTDAPRDGPDASNENRTADTDESKELSELRQKLKDAENEAALTKQELKNAEDMLNSSLAREEELKSKLNGTSGNE